MTTAQIITLIILGILILIGYFGTTLSKTDSKRFPYLALWMGVSILIYGLLIIMTIERESALKQLKGKCPEYEKIENVYKLKQ